MIIFVFDFFRQRILYAAFILYTEDRKVEEKIVNLDQSRAPIYEALEQFRQMRVVPFDVPGHKRGRGNPELTEFLGKQCVGVDVNSMKPLDNL